MCVVTEELSLRLYRRRVPRHPLGNRRRAHPPRRHAGAAGALPPQDRVRRDPAHRRVHRAQYRLRSCLAANAEPSSTAITTRCKGSKTWITHAARANLMTILCRTKPDEAGYRGLSILLAEKPRGTDERAVSGGRPFRRRNSGSRLSRHEGIHPLLRWLQSPESLRPARRCRGSGLQAADGHLRKCASIQTAARAIGVAQNALDVGLAYAKERIAVRRSRSMPSRGLPTSSPGWRSKS